MKRKHLFAALLALALVLAMLAGCGGQGTAEEEQSAASSAGEENSSEEGAELLSGKHHVQIEVQDYGTISLELDADAAPITVTNFIDLANAGFYDGLTFHRVAAGFVLQGGDPNGDGTGGSDTEITGEFSANGYENSLSHTRGAISMARRSNSYDSATSQFFIVLDDAAASSLDGQYACFGYVTEGMELVDQICEDTPVADMSSGLVEAENQPVITKITVED